VAMNAREFKALAQNPFHYSMVSINIDIRITAAKDEMGDPFGCVEWKYDHEEGQDDGENLDMCAGHVLVKAAQLLSMGIEEAWEVIGAIYSWRSKVHEAAGTTPIYCRPGMHLN
jgi:hypothetical protein